MLKGLVFLHKQKLTHTDLKPENILFIHNSYQEISDPTLIPEHVKLKKEVYGSDYLSDFSEISKKPYLKQKRLDIKIIDFGGATFDKEYHSRIINTRHYRSPEVILGCGWTEISDIWSLACILLELYTGEMLFSVHKNLEHLVMIE